MAKNETKNNGRKIQGGKLIGLAVSLIDLVAAAVFLMQDNKYLWGLGAVLVLQAGYWFAENVILSSQINN